ncbi:dehydrogenase [Massilia eurypsychrophila]|jgi:putative NADPH-quinone reductase|uniref:Dehydrogenase n=1 Tax=Massilia eurypsychrophila TaxID=1485217 RepID=A0A2G8TG28_9BURK|nr:NAD(P)H-dependent oxidoreductase [Massilia eurypsychrophila]PIL45011.1 dehydrogenase [Massilia eurypsychrophila]
MTKRILLIQGHPDAGHHHLCEALEQAYQEGAVGQGHEVRRIHLSELNFPLLRSQHEWEHGELPVCLRAAQNDVRWAQHIVFFFPLWLGDMPALLKGFLEQIARPGFAFGEVDGTTSMLKKGLLGRSARIVVTMGMPATLYKFYFRAHSIKSMKRNILQFVGMNPVDDTVIGMAGQMDADKADRWLRRLASMGRSAA